MLLTFASITIVKKYIVCWYPGKKKNTVSVDLLNGSICTFNCTMEEFERFYLDTETIEGDT